MIETVVALLMFINGEIKEHRIQENMAICLRGKRTAERDYNPNVSYKCIKAKAETEIYMDQKSIKKIILEQFEVMAKAEYQELINEYKEQVRVLKEQNNELTDACKSKDQALKRALQKLEYTTEDLDKLQEQKNDETK